MPGLYQPAYGSRCPEGVPVPAVVLTGTTASRKSEVAVELALRIGAEILSLDSMLVYRGMDIGTAKPRAADRARVPHHLIDILDPLESMNLARFVSLAEEVALEIAARGRVVLAVGGTALYLKGFLHGVFPGPSADPAFRAGLREEALRLGVPALHARLAASDPAAAARLHPNDYKRIERALEVLSLSGRPISDWQQEWRAGPRRPARIFVLTRPRPLLDQAIDARVREMVEAGFVDEVRGLFAGGGLGPQAREALGYREVAGHLEGEADLESTIARIQRATRRFARKQLTWFRRLEGAEWIDPGETPAADLARILADRLAEGPGRGQPI
jgi:tRNA dimethylallyltransferase